MLRNQEIDDYIAQSSATKEQKKYFEFARNKVHEIWPTTVEKISYAMPAFYPDEKAKGRQLLIYLSLNKKWLGFYPMPAFIYANESLLNELNLNFSKGAIQIPYDTSKDILTDLLERAIEFNGRKYLEDK
ncbi:iron chaperone [Floricoccus penangensis]|uniref:iron chaperone n=1 Tax=Floricoccus penangensis TaxID=1859475 RepID=UPI00203A865F|nr:hypothetical protein [Floricoccus penangensis]URZ87309.1 hypothetical protein KIW23_09620 [Floricoccus penangensis]